MEDIIVAAITIGIPSTVTFATALIQSRVSNKHAARQSILQLIMEDHITVAEGGFPTHYQSGLHEFDIYKKAGGNSYISEKVETYKKWLKEQEENRK